MRPPPLSPLGRLRWALVCEELGRIGPATVLEVGCGQGAVGARLAGRYGYVGVEPDRESFEVARQRIEPAGGRVYRGTVADVPDGRFDVVCAFEVLEHIDDDAAALRAWCRRLAPEGTLILSVPAGPERFGASDRAVGHYRRYTRDGIVALMAEVGMGDVTAVHYGWPLGLATEAVRNWLVTLRGGPDAAVGMASRSSASGRSLQPGALAGLVVEAVSPPFVALQRRCPDRGVGLVVTGRPEAARASPETI
ncbi:MAG: class I SAM-dependent methyltransferase [Acidobacteriota bacterium]|nr:class I SAM-dependent methyltransferase [Acidobacteriota bacterium]